MMHNGGNHNTIIKEAGKFLKEARDLEQKEANELEFAYVQLEILMMVIHSIVTKVPGQDTSQYSNWHWKETEKRKALYLECDSEDIKQVQALSDVVKCRDLVKTFWGMEVKLSKVIVKQRKTKRRGEDPVEDTGHQQLNRYRSYCIKHIDYNSSTTYMGVIGVFDIDKRVDIYSVNDIEEVVGNLNLRSVFYAMNMLDGNPLIAEIHQADPMMNVDVVVGNTEEAIACVNMFNKNIAAYLMYNSPIKEVGKEFIKRLLRVSFDPELIRYIGDYTWDKKTWVLTTPKDIEDSGKKKLEYAASWV